MAETKFIIFMLTTLVFFGYFLGSFASYIQTEDQKIIEFSETLKAVSIPEEEPPGDLKWYEKVYNVVTDNVIVRYLRVIIPFVNMLTSPELLPSVALIGIISVIGFYMIMITYVWPLVRGN